MHKKSYASGFLYHLPSQQILLQQQPIESTSTSPWILFSEPYTGDEMPEQIFKEKILKILNVKINTVHPIYTYFDEPNNASHFIVYSKLNKLQEFPPQNGLNFAWFAFKEIVKLNVLKQTKHDIVVGQRVIDAAARISRGEHSFQ
jgi:hypothetical protein